MLESLAQLLPEYNIYCAPLGPVTFTNQQIQNTYLDIKQNK